MEDAASEVGGEAEEQGHLEPMVEVTGEIREEYQYDDDDFEVGQLWRRTEVVFEALFHPTFPRSMMRTLRKSLKVLRIPRQMWKSPHLLTTLTRGAWEPWI